MSRRFQFSLRGLLVAIAVAAIVATFLAHTAEIVRVRNVLRRRFHDRPYAPKDEPQASLETWLTSPRARVEPNSSLVKAASTC
jgi:hypothetical protein